MLIKKRVCDRCRTILVEQNASNEVIDKPCDKMITVQVTNESLGIDSTFDYCSLNCFTNSIIAWYQKGVFDGKCDMHIVCREITKEELGNG